MATRSGSAAAGQVHTRPLVSTVALAVAVVFLLVGILGFIPGVTTNYGDMRAPLPDRRRGRVRRAVAVRPRDRPRQQRELRTAQHGRQLAAPRAGRWHDRTWPAGVAPPRYRTTVTERPFHVPGVRRAPSTASAVEGGGRPGGTTSERPPDWWITLRAVGQHRRSSGWSMPRPSFLPLSGWSAARAAGRPGGGAEPGDEGPLSIGGGRGGGDTGWLHQASMEPKGMLPTSHHFSAVATVLVALSQYGTRPVPRTAAGSSSRPHSMIRWAPTGWCSHCR
jgi:hypothetical protein